MSDSEFDKPSAPLLAAGPPAHGPQYQPPPTHPAHYQSSPHDFNPQYQPAPSTHNPQYQPAPSTHNPQYQPAPSAHNPQYQPAPPTHNPQYQPAPPTHNPQYQPTPHGYSGQYQPAPSTFTPQPPPHAMPGYYPGAPSHTSTNVVVVSQPAPSVLVPEPPKVHDYFDLSVITLVLCILCGGLPFALCAGIAIGFSLKAREHKENGNYEAARRNGKYAVWLNILAYVSGPILYIAAIIVAFIYGSVSRV